MSSSNVSCSICAESYGSDEICSTVCGHIFHFGCLRQWLQRSNTCPLCNRSYPEPHRIYLDIKAIEESAVKNDSENVVVIKNVQPNQINPLSTTVMMLINTMNVPIKENDIGTVWQIGNKLHVSFKATIHRDMFLRHKNKLRNNPQTSAIRIHEVLDAEINVLFRYSHKLKDNGYTIFFVKNNKVYVKKDKHSEPVNILSQSHVDTLCAGVENRTPNLSHTFQNNIQQRYSRREYINHTYNPRPETRHLNTQEQEGCNIL